jgi:hypothetical protein
MQGMCESFRFFGYVDKLGIFFLRARSQPKDNKTGQFGHIENQIICLQFVLSYT